MRVANEGAVRLDSHMTFVGWADAGDSWMILVIMPTGFLGCAGGGYMREWVLRMGWRVCYGRNYLVLWT